MKMNSQVWWRVSRCDHSVRLQRVVRLLAQVTHPIQRRRALLALVFTHECRAIANCPADTGVARAGALGPRRVAQIFNLLYRRFATCGLRSVGMSRRDVRNPSARPIANRRYGRLQTCATVTTVVLPRTKSGEGWRCSSGTSEFSGRICYARVSVGKDEDRTTAPPLLRISPP